MSEPRFGKHTNARIRDEVEWKDRLRKLVMDLRQPSSIPVLMDEIDRELICMLTTKVGMLMEDHSALALTMGSKSAEEQKAAMKELAVAAKTIAALSSAAQSIAK